MEEEGESKKYGNGDRLCSGSRLALTALRHANKSARQLQALRLISLASLPSSRSASPFPQEWDPTSSASASNTTAEYRSISEPTETTWRRSGHDLAREHDDHLARLHSIARSHDCQTLDPKFYIKGPR